MNYVQRFYVDGERQKTTKPAPLDTLRKWLDNIERDWSKNGLFPLTLPGDFDLNNAYSVTRVSLDELLIVSTSGKQLRWVNVPKTGRA